MSADDTGETILVGVGVSSDDVEPLSEFLNGIPDDVRATFLIVQHPTANSHSDPLPELLQRSTSRPVRLAEHDNQLTESAILIAPPGSVMTVTESAVELVESRGAGAVAIDRLLRSIADAAANRCVAVLLSGSTTDGTLGARAVRGNGGLVIAQDPATAQFATMPSNAISDGIADIVSPADEMGSLIASFADKVAGSGKVATSKNDSKLQGSLRRILTCLHNQTGHDFSTYKENTVVRRIIRRMTLRQIDGPEEYLSCIEEDANEAEQLFRDLLIEVTRFFRDEEAYATLQAAVRDVLLPVFEGETLRAWVPGCASGEEAYSIAIILHEAIEAAGRSIAVDVFATDLNEAAVAVARKGAYPLAIASDVSDGRLKRFFYEHDAHYYVNPQIRESLVFAVQDVTKDPPFSNLDLVSCRNLLIYLKPETQRTVLGRFRYGLRSGALLFLGSSESVGPLPGAFEAIQKDHRVFRAINNAPRTHVGELPIPSRWAEQMQSGPNERTERDDAALRTKSVAERLILGFAPPSVLVTTGGTAIYFHGRTGRYFEPAPGVARSNVIEMARPGLTYELSAALYKAAIEGRPQVRPGITIETNNQRETVDLFVMPAEFESDNEPCFLITLRESVGRPEASGVPVGDLDEEAARRIRELQGELETSRRDMQALIEEHEATNEELKSSNEELQSTNEELKSTNEELETSKEELQSIVEEQTTQNDELQSRNAELVQVRDDMDNLLAGTQIATLFLDESLKIRRFTPAMHEIMGLRATDLGRPAGDIALRLDYGDLVADAERVLHDLNTLEREIFDREGRWFQLRIVPYRTGEKVIDGVVATFNDITQLKQSLLQAEFGQSLAESTINTVQQPLIVLTLDHRIETVNAAFLSTFHLSRNQTIGEQVFALPRANWDVAVLREALAQVAGDGGTATDLSFDLSAQNGQVRSIRAHLRMVPTPDGRDGRDGRMLAAFLVNDKGDA